MDYNCGKPYYDSVNCCQMCQPSVVGPCNNNLNCTVPNYVRCCNMQMPNDCIYNPMCMWCRPAVPRLEQTRARPSLWECENRINPQATLDCKQDSPKKLEKKTKSKPSRPPSPKKSPVKSSKSPARPSKSTCSPKKEKPAPKLKEKPPKTQKKAIKSKPSETVCRCSQCMSQEQNIKYIESEAKCNLHDPIDNCPEIRRSRCDESMDTRFLMEPVKVLQDSDYPEKSPIPICHCGKSQTSDKRKSSVNSLCEQNRNQAQMLMSMERIKEKNSKMDKKMEKTFMPNETIVKSVNSCKITSRNKSQCSCCRLPSNECLSENITQCMGMEKMPPKSAENMCRKESYKEKNNLSKKEKQNSKNRESRSRVKKSCCDSQSDNNRDRHCNSNYSMNSRNSSNQSCRQNMCPSKTSSKSCDQDDDSLNGCYTFSELAINFADVRMMHSVCNEDQDQLCSNKKKSQTSCKSEKSSEKMKKNQKKSSTSSKKEKFDDTKSILKCQKSSANGSFCTKNKSTPTPSKECKSSSNIISSSNRAKKSSSNKNNKTLTKNKSDLKKSNSKSLHQKSPTSSRGSISSSKDRRASNSRASSTNKMKKTTSKMDNKTTSTNKKDNAKKSIHSLSTSNRPNKTPSGPIKNKENTKSNTKKTIKSTPTTSNKDNLVKEKTSSKTKLAPKPPINNEKKSNQDFYVNSTAACNCNCQNKGSKILHEKSSTPSKGNIVFPKKQNISDTKISSSSCKNQNGNVIERCNCECSVKNQQKSSTTTIDTCKGNENSNPNTANNSEPITNRCTCALHEHTTSNASSLPKNNKTSAIQKDDENLLKRDKCEPNNANPCLCKNNTNRNSKEVINTKQSSISAKSNTTPSTGKITSYRSRSGMSTEIDKFVSSKDDLNKDLKKSKSFTSLKISDTSSHQNPIKSQTNQIEEYFSCSQLMIPIKKRSELKYNHDEPIDNNEAAQQYHQRFKNNTNNLNENDSRNYQDQSSNTPKLVQMIKVLENNPNPLLCSQCLGKCSELFKKTMKTARCNLHTGIKKSRRYSSIKEERPFRKDKRERFPLERLQIEDPTAKYVDVEQALRNHGMSQRTVVDGISFTDIESDQSVAEKRTENKCIVEEEILEGCNCFHHMNLRNKKRNIGGRERSTFPNLQSFDNFISNEVRCLSDDLGQPLIMYYDSNASTITIAKIGDPIKRFKLTQFGNETLPNKNWWIKRCWR